MKYETKKTLPGPLLVKAAVIAGISLIAYFVLASSSIAQKAEANVLPPCTLTLCNVSFENGNLDYWAPVGTATNTVSMDAVHGTYSLNSQQDATGAQPAAWAGAKQAINGVQSSQTYTLNMWIKTLNAAQAHIKVVWYDSGSSVSKVDYPIGNINGTNDWLWLGNLITSPADAASAEMFILHGVDNVGQNVQGSTIWADIVDFDIASNGCGMLCNENFEQGLLYWSVRGDAPSHKIETTDPYEGLQALKSEQLYTGADPVKWTGISQSTAVNGGGMYRLKMWVKTLNAVLGHVKVKWYDSGEALISTETVIQDINGTNPTWTPQSYMLIAPANAVRAEIVVRHGVSAYGGLHNTPGSTLWLDNITLLCINLCNGGFEDGNVFWETNGANKGTIVTNSVQEGTQAIQVMQNQSAAANPQWAGINQRFLLAGPGNYFLSFWVRKSSTVGGHAKIKWYGLNDQLISQESPIVGITGTDSTWERRSAFLQSPLGAETVEIFIWHGIDGSSNNVPGSTLDIDNVKFLQYLGAENMGFEQGFDYWNTLGKPGSYSIDTVGASEGVNSFKSEQLYTGSDPVNWAGVTRTFTVVGDMSYAVFFDYKSLNAVLGHVKVRWYDASGSSLGSSTVLQGINGTNPTWITGAGNVVNSPAGAARGEVIFWHGVSAFGGLHNVPGSTLWIDNFNFGAT